MSGNLAIATKNALESVENMPVKGAKQVFLRELFINGGDSSRAAGIAYPNHSRPSDKGAKLMRELAPYIRIAAADYTEQLRPVALGVVVKLMKDPLSAGPVRLKAAEIVLERADRLVDPKDGGTKGQKDTLDSIIRYCFNAVGEGLARQLLASKGIPAGKVDEVLASITGPKIVKEEDESVIVAPGP